MPEDTQEPFRYAQDVLDMLDGHLGGGNVLVIIIHEEVLQRLVVVLASVVEGDILAVDVVLLLPQRVALEVDVARLDEVLVVLAQPPVGDGPGPELVQLPEVVHVRLDVLALQHHELLVGLDQLALPVLVIQLGLGLVVVEVVAVHELRVVLELLHAALDVVDVLVRKVLVR